MKKILFLLFIFANGILLAADPNEAMLKGLSDSSGGMAGASGLFMVHGFFFGPIILASATALIIIGVYYRMFKQKDDGAWKTIAFFAIGIVAGIIIYVGSLKVIDGLLKADGCGSEIATAYIKDSMKKGLNSSYQFGTTIRGLSCLQ